MSHTFRLVRSPLHTPKRQTTQQCLFRSPLNLPQKLLNFFRMNFVIPGFYLYIISEVPDKSTKFHNLFRIGCFMGTVYERNLHPVKMLCHSFIREQHKILDDLIGNPSFIRLNGNRITLFVQFNFTLRKIKVNGSSALSFFTKNVGQLLHTVEHGNLGFIPPAKYRIMFFQNLIHISIVHTLVHMNDTLYDLMIDDIPFLIYGHQTA